MTTVTQPTQPTLTPEERQLILRRLKHGPALDRVALAKYATQLRLETLATRPRKQVQ